MITITTLTNSFILNGTQYGKGKLTVTPTPDGAKFGYVYANLDEIEVDGQTYATIEELHTALDTKLFKSGGGSGEGLQWDDTSIMPSPGKIPVFSEQGLLSTGDPLFPENAVNLNYVNSLSGWAVYNDSVHTSSIPLVINEGSRVKITNNANSVINNQLPSGVTSWWNSSTSKITPSNNGDSYLVNLRFTAVSSSNTGLADVEIDIGGSQSVVDGSTISLRKGTGSSQRVSLKFDIYTLDTFLANGGEFYLRSIDGNTSIYDIRLKITRTHTIKGA